MTEWVTSASLFSLGTISTSAVVVAGMVAAIAERQRANSEKELSEIRRELAADPESKLREIKRLEEELQTKRQQLVDLDRERAAQFASAARAERLRDEISQLEATRSQLQPIREEAERLREQAKQHALLASQSDQAHQWAEQRREAAEWAAHAAEQRREGAASGLALLEAQAATVREDLDTATADLDELRGQLRDAERGRLEAHAVIERASQLQRKSDELQSISDAYERAQVELTTARSELAAIHTQLLTFRAELEDLTARKSLLESQLGERNADGDAMVEQDIVNERVADIWKPTLRRVATEPSIAKEAESLGRVQDYLNGLGLVFHDRTVLAFHTALKVAWEAPLLVLAGISGTGKSLLPKRYAEAMGMNFCLVPVQPRWDGPQDLLGFYNFLQGKQVPTELLRALVQMHPFPEDWEAFGVHEEGCEFESLRDQMLIVLLDEMNLARVEYYFSEFLSRLEVRRTIDESSRDSRSQVSLLIDAGPLPPHLHAPKIYPGRNTLFVGTMNEDETTQSLSDKVVDRANVMRFARPRVAAVADPKQRPTAPEFRLRESTWRSWQTATLSQSDRDKLEASTQQLNDALAMVGRPFGFRLTTAIRSYAQMYPAHAPNRTGCVIADQIEMRILPKLRGIELDERGAHAIDQVRIVAGQTGDEELCRAIDEAHDPTTNRFHWAGVTRSS